MATQRDVAFGRLAIARGLVSAEAVRATYRTLAPGRSLAEALVAARLLAPPAAAALARELATAPGAAPPDARASSSSSVFARPTPTAAPDGDAVATVHLPATTAAPPDVTRAAAPSARDPTRAGIGAEPRGQLPAVGERIGAYEVEGVLGQGGMGAVYRARGPGGDAAAIKVMLPGEDADPPRLERFRREAEAIAKVDRHGGVVRVREVGDHRGCPYAVLDLIEGQDLAALVEERGPLPVEEALELMERLARTVHRCHGEGVLHRDLKPANVLVRAADGAAFVTDFGLALDLDAAERLSRTGEVMGTPSYMAPEQAEGDKEAVDARTDVYALGAILYHLATGEAPFKGGQAQVLKQVLLDLPAPIQRRRPQAPGDLDAIVRRAMAKEREDRYPTAAELADDLARLRGGEPIATRAPRRFELLRWRWRRLRRRSPRLVTASALLLSLAVVAAPVALFIYADPARRAAQELERALADELPRALEAGDPLLREAAAGAADAPDAQELAKRLARLGVQAELIAAEPPASADAGALAALVAALERLVGAPPVTPARRIQLRRLTRRLRLAARLGLGEGPGPTPPAAEDRLLQTLHALGWGRADAELRLEPGALDAARAELERLAAAEGPAGRAAADALGGCEALDAQAERYLEAGLATHRAPDGAATSTSGWPAYDELRTQAAAAFDEAAGRREDLLVDAWLRARLAARKPEVALEALGLLRDRLTTGTGSGDLHPVTAFERFRAAWANELRPFIRNDGGRHAPAADLDPEQERRLRGLVTDLVQDLAQRARSRDYPGEVRFLELLYEAREVIDWSREELAYPVYDLLIHGVRDYLLERKLPPIRLCLVLVPLNRRPGSVWSSTLARYVEEGRLEGYEAEHGPSGDLSALWGHILYELWDEGPGEDDLDMLEDAMSRFADALGPELDPERRRRLGLPELTARRGWSPVAQSWAPYLRTRLAHAVVTYQDERADRGAGPVDAERVAAAAELLGAQWELEAEAFGGTADWMRYALIYADVLDELLDAAPDAPDRQEIEARLEALFARATPIGWELAEAASRERAPAEGPVGLYQADATLDLDHMLRRLVRFVRRRAGFLRARNEAGATREAVAWLRTSYERLRREPLRRSQPRLLTELAFAERELAGLAPAERAAHLDAAASAAEAALAELQPQLTGPDSDKVRERADEARSVLALVHLDRGEVDAAQELYDERLLPAQGGSPVWGDVGARLDAE